MEYVKNTIYFIVGAIVIILSPIWLPICMFWDMSVIGVGKEILKDY